MRNRILSLLKLLLEGVILIPLLMGCHCSNSYEIDGRVTNDLTTEGKKIYLSYTDGEPIDSTVIRQGRFQFKGKVSHGEKALMAVLRLPPYYVLPVVLEPGYKIDAHMEEYGAKGSPLNDEMCHFIAHIDSVETLHLNSLRKIASIDSPAIAREKLSPTVIDDVYQAMRQGKLEVAKKTLSLHPNDVVGAQAFLFALTETGVGQDKEIDKLYSQLGPVIKEDPQVKYLRELRKNRKKAIENNLFVDFPVIRKDGSVVNLSDCLDKGKYTLLLFWSVWGEYSLVFSRELIKLHSLYRNEPFQIISVQLAKGSRKGCSQNGIILPWEQVVDYNDEAVRSYYQVKNEPTSVLIHPNGKIIARDLHSDSLREELQKLFGAGKAQ